MYICGQVLGKTVQYRYLLSLGGKITRYFLFYNFLQFPNFLWCIYNVFHHKVTLKLRTSSTYNSCVISPFGTFQRSSNARGINSWCLVWEPSFALSPIPLWLVVHVLIMSHQVCPCLSAHMASTQDIGSLPLATSTFFHPSDQAVALRSLTGAASLGPDAFHPWEIKQLVLQSWSPSSL